MNYTISQMAQKFGIEPHTLRFYEKEGIISPQRTSGGIRSYTDENVAQLEIAMCLKSTGMPLKDIRKYFELVREGDDTLDMRLQMFENHREHVLEEIAELQKYLCKIEFKIGRYKQFIEEKRKAVS